MDSFPKLTSGQDNSTPQRNLSISTPFFFCCPKVARSFFYLSTFTHTLHKGSVLKEHHHTFTAFRLTTKTFDFSPHCRGLGGFNVRVPKEKRRIQQPVSLLPSIQVVVRVVVVEVTKRWEIFAGYMWTENKASHPKKCHSFTHLLLFCASFACPRQLNAHLIARPRPCITPL